MATNANTEQNTLVFGQNNNPTEQPVLATENSNQFQLDVTTQLSLQTEEVTNAATDKNLLEQTTAGFNSLSATGTPVPAINLDSATDNLQTNSILATNPPLAATGQTVAMNDLEVTQQTENDINFPAATGTVPTFTQEDLEITPEALNPTQAGTQLPGTQGTALDIGLPGTASLNQFTNNFENIAEPTQPTYTGEPMTTPRERQDFTGTSNFDPPEKPSGTRPSLMDQGTGQPRTEADSSKVG